MELQRTSESSKLNATTYRLICYSLVALMIACATTTVISLANRFIPSWQPTYLVVLCFIIALDRLYTYRIFRNWLFLSREWLILFGAQAIIIIALTKITVGLSHGWVAFLTEIPTWRENFPASFINPESGFALILALVTWLICGNFADMLEEIGPDQLQSSRLDLVSYGLEQAVSTRRRLISLFFSLGTALVFLTMLCRIDQRVDFAKSTYDASIQIPILAAGGASTLLYFMLGLGLLSQTQFISLHIRWNLQDIPINGKLAKQWAGYSLLFLGVIALVVSMLPTSYGIQPLALLGSLLNMILNIFLFIGQSIYLFLVYLLGFLFRLFGRDENTDAAPMEPKAPANPLPISDSAIAPGPGWWEAIKMIVFWTVFLSVAFWAVRQYLRQHQDLIEALRKLPGWRYLEQFWGWLQNLLTQVKAEIEMAIKMGRENARHGIPWRGFGDGFINLRKLDPRQRVYFFYLAFVRRAGEKNTPRSSHQTPDEYAAALQSALPAAADDIHAITDAFMNARYSRQPVDMEQSQRVETIWDRLRRTLKGKR